MRKLQLIFLLLFTLKSWGQISENQTETVKNIKARSYNYYVAKWQSRSWEQKSNYYIEVIPEGEDRVKLLFEGEERWVTAFVDYKGQKEVCYSYLKSLTNNYDLFYYDDNFYLFYKSVMEEKGCGSCGKITACYAKKKPESYDKIEKLWHKHRLKILSERKEALSEAKLNYGKQNPEKVWSEVFEEKNGYRKVRYDKKYAIINSAGDLIINPIYDEIDENITNNLIRVRKGDKCGYMTVQNSVGIPLIYKQISEISDGYIMAQDYNTKKWYFLDKKGKIVSRHFDKAKTFRDGKAEIILGTDLGFLDTKLRENWLVKNSGFKTFYRLNEDYIRVENDEGKMGLFKLSNKMLDIPCNYYNIQILKSDLLLVYDLKKDVGIYHTKNGWLTEVVYDKAYVDKDNELVIEVQEKIGKVDANNNIKWSDGTFTPHSKVAEQTWRKKYDWSWITTNGEITPVFKDKFYGFVDETGKEIFSNKFNDVKIATNGFFIVKEGDKYGLINKEGNLSIPCKYETLSQLSDKKFRAINGDKGYIIDDSDNLLEEFSLNIENKKFIGFNKNTRKTNGCYDYITDYFSMPDGTVIQTGVRNGVSYFGPVDRYKNKFEPFEYNKMYLENIGTTTPNNHIVIAAGNTYTSYKIENNKAILKQQKSFSAENLYCIDMVNISYNEVAGLWKSKGNLFLSAWNSETGEHFFMKITEKASAWVVEGKHSGAFNIAISPTNEVLAINYAKYNESNKYEDNYIMSIDVASSREGKKFYVIENKKVSAKRSSKLNNNVYFKDILVNNNNEIISFEYFDNKKDGFVFHKYSKDLKVIKELKKCYLDPALYAGGKFFGVYDYSGLGYQREIRFDLMQNPNNGQIYLFGKINNQQKLTHKYYSNAPELSEIFYNYSPVLISIDQKELTPYAFDFFDLIDNKRRIEGIYDINNYNPAYNISYFKLNTLKSFMSFSENNNPVLYYHEELKDAKPYPRFLWEVELELGNELKKSEVMTNLKRDGGGGSSVSSSSANSASNSSDDDNNNSNSNSESPVKVNVKFKSGSSLKGETIYIYYVDLNNSNKKMRIGRNSSATVSVKKGTDMYYTIDDNGSGRNKKEFYTAPNRDSMQRVEL